MFTGHKMPSVTRAQIMERKGKESLSFLSFLSIRLKAMESDGKKWNFSGRSFICIYPWICWFILVISMHAQNTIFTLLLHDCYKKIGQTHTFILVLKTVLAKLRPKSSTNVCLSIRKKGKERNFPFFPFFPSNWILSINLSPEYI